MENRHGFLPFGFKFKPTNAELVWYLLHKVHSLALPCNFFIIDCDLYDGKDRWKEIYERSPAATPHLYLFTKLKKITEKGTLKEDGGNRNRKTGGGTWKETQNCGTILDPNTKKPIGNKRSFKFKPNPGTAAQFTGRWLMDEFSLDSRFAHQNVDDYVVCCIKHERDRKSKNSVQQMRNSEQLIQEDCRNTSNNDSINDTAAATTLVIEDGLADFGDQNLCLDSDELNALLDDNNQLLAPMIEENGRDSDCLFATLEYENRATNNVQMRDSEQVFEVDCRISEANNDAIEATTSDFKNDATEFEDPNVWVELDELLGNLDQTSAAMVAENVSDLDCQFATPTTLSGSGVGTNNSLTNTSSFMMDTPIHNQCFQEKAATSNHQFGCC